MPGHWCGMEVATATVIGVVASQLASGYDGQVFLQEQVFAGGSMASLSACVGGHCLLVEWVGGGSSQLIVSKKKKGSSQLMSPPAPPMGH